ncbi:FG-GAP-like repeat-containing protein [Fluviicola taffensis]|uniref:FG-GAP-like repeat-containing protein n=1 Tax=Fluviicola taffensis TaxID=191579 RepID=UPI0031377BEA
MTIQTMKNSTLLLFLLISSIAIPQFGSINVIDNSAASQGIRRLVAADLNNDNQNEIIVAQAFTNQVAYYSTMGNGSFASKTIIDSTLSYPVYLAVGDLNGDQSPDLTTVGQTYGEVVIYLNNGSAGFIKQEVDSGIIFLNALVVKDFDNNGSPDIVVIGQHSIDFYRNNGNASFTKEHILTTQTSPNVLECMYIETADMNNDGHPDVITAETIGGVVYYNDGAGNFTPQLITSEQFITRLVHAVDINNDGFKDVVVQHSTGDVKLYLNNGDETFQLEGTLFNSASITSMESVDADADGFQDLYMAYSNKVRMLYNNGDETFGGQTFLYENNSLFTNEVLIANIDSNSDPEFIWSAVGGTLAYHKSTVLGLTSGKETEIQIYPNPTSDLICIESSEEIHRIHLFNLHGEKITFRESANTATIDLSALASGSYLLEVIGENSTVKRIITKI